jgi:hypothetical protein
VRSSICGRSFGDRAELWGKVPDDVLAAVALLGGDARLLDQLPPALVPVAVALEAALALVSVLRSRARVRVLVLGKRCAPIVLALLSAPAAAAGAAAGRVLAGWFRLSAAIAAPLDRRWLRLRAWASARLLGVFRTANDRFRGGSGARGAVQLFADELDDDLADELGDGPAQLVSDERLERLPGRRGHGAGVYDEFGAPQFYSSRGPRRGWRRRPTGGYPSPVAMGLALSRLLPRNATSSSM